MEPNAIQSGLRGDLRGAWRFARATARRDTWARETALQALKAAVAAVLAWFIASQVLALPQPYLAPWAALIVVRPTVHWSALTGLRQMAAVALGVAVAVAAVAVTPGRELALAACVPVALLLSHWPRLDDQGLYVPFTALFMVAVDNVDEPYVLARLVETALGAGVGIGLNLLLVPPGRVRAVGTRLHRDAAATAGLLREVAAALRSGRDRTEDGDWSARAKTLETRGAGTAATLDRARNSLRLNPQSTAEEYAVLDRCQAALEHHQRVGNAAKTLADLLDGRTRRAMPDTALDPAYRRACAAALEAAADAHERQVAHLLQHPCDDASPAPADASPLEALKARAHDEDAGPAVSELRATVLAAVRRLFHELAA
jgi:uncharacterized membrane protein YgaE (UPF0421/DUF939 family)